jgi:hypothetical protein
MAKGPRAPRLRSDFNLGGEQAEADPLLSSAFFESGDYAAIESFNDPRCFIVGRTGVGKSAVLQHLEASHPGRVIRITPEDLSLPYITDLGVIKYLDDLDVHLDLLFIALWKHVLLVELLRHRYSVNSPEAKQKFMEALRDKVRRDPAKRAALDYLEEYQDRFWCEADERVVEITKKFEERISVSGKGGIPAGAPIAASVEASAARDSGTESKSELQNRFQRIVNDTQLARLNKMLNVLDEDVFDEQHTCYVVIDDLDRDWVDERISNDLIRCLFRTVLDLKRVKNVKVLVALRTNIFQQLEFSKSAGGQEEKFRALVLRMKWNRRDLISVLNERARAASDVRGGTYTAAQDIFPRTNKTKGNPLDFVIDRTLMRPRDAISFANEAILVASGTPKVTWDDIRKAEGPYSEKRLLALRDEWKSTFPGIHHVFELFRGKEVPMDRDTLAAILDDAMLLPANREFDGVVWMTAASDVMLGSGAGGNSKWADLYGSLTKILFDIGFLGLIDAKGSTIYSHEDPSYVNVLSPLEELVGVTVHPAFQAALDLKTRARGQRVHPSAG